MRILIFGTFDETRHPRVSTLREGLADLGHEIESLNRPLRDSTTARLQAARYPLRAARWLLRLLGAWVRLLVSSVRVRHPEVVLVGYLGVFDVMVARLRWPRSLVVLDHMAALGAVATDRGLGGWATRLFGMVDRIAEACANLVMFDTDDNASLSSTPEHKKIVISVGAPSEWFVGSGAGVPGDEMNVVFYGLFTPLQGAPVIGEAMAALADEPIRFTMIGGGQGLEATRKAAGSTARAQWIDWVVASDLPGLVSRHDVCLGIFGTTPKAGRVVPNKVFQGAAAGCAVVTSDTPVQRAALGNGALYVPPGDAQALADTLQALAHDRARLMALRAAARAQAEMWRPVAVAEPLTEVLVRLAKTKTAHSSRY